MQTNSKYFLCVGVKKGGTTFLYDQLREIEDFFLPPIKETHFLLPLSKQRKNRFKEILSYKLKENTFIKNISDEIFLKKYFYDNDEDTIHNYLKLLNCDKSKICGEVDPELLLLDKNKIIELSKFNINVVIILRHPIDRFFSHIKMISKKVNENPNILIKNNFSKYHHQINHSYYRVFLRNWLNNFPKQNLLFIDNKSLRSNRYDAMLKIYRFIKRDHKAKLNHSLILKRDSNVGSSISLDRKLYESLFVFFKKDIELYEKIINHL